MSVLKWISLFVFYSSPVCSQHLLMSGPYVNSELRTAVLWAEVSAKVKTVSLVYYKKSNPAVKNNIHFNGVLGREFNPLKIYINRLEPETVYNYELLLNGKQADIPSNSNNSRTIGTFSTKVFWQYRKPAPDFSFITGSCSYINEPSYDRPGKPYGSDSSIFQSMANENAAFCLWLGDNWYTREVDYNSVWGLRYRPSRDRSMKIVQPLLTGMSQYGIWDDHDFGPNNSNKSYVLKDSSRKIFMDYFANPSFGEDGQGIYTKFSFSDVDFFLMDDRYFRSDQRMRDSIDGKPSPQKTFFGDKQMQWLKSALLQSNAPFKIIACGNQVLNEGSVHESMRKYSFEWKDLMSFLSDHKIEGVIFLTGDRHHSEIIKLERGHLYTLYDITVSPLTAGVGRLSDTERLNAARVEGTLIEKQNYARLSVKGEKGKRNLEVEFLDVQGNKISLWQISEQMLKISGRNN